MFNLTNLFKKNELSQAVLSKDEIAKILKTTPEALQAFEDSYRSLALDEEPESFFETNSRQASAGRRASGGQAAPGEMDSLCSRIVAELIAQTSRYVYDGKSAYVENGARLPDGTALVKNEDIWNFPEKQRPQLAGNLMKKDTAGDTSGLLLSLYQDFMDPSNKSRRLAYNLFRQGLDIQDLDPITYEIIGTNRNSIGHWLPELVDAVARTGFFKIPATTVVKVPLTLLQLTRLSYAGLTEATIRIVDEWAYKAFSLDCSREYFIKTGTYSSKFDYRNAYVHGAKEVRELGEYLLYIHYQALQMASPLSSPSIYGVSTTNEWVVREYIPDKEGNPTIYKGLPLHTEYRVFVDCDTDEVIGISPYWEPETMKERFGHGHDADSPHQVHDYIIYQAHEETLMRRYYENKDRVLAHVNELLPALGLKGQWSLDIMQNGDDFWLIDMALAENSAFYECVPENLRNPSKEDWIPKLPVEGQN